MNKVHLQKFYPESLVFQDKGQFFSTMKIWSHTVPVVTLYQEPDV